MCAATVHWLLGCQSPTACPSWPTLSSLGTQLGCSKMPWLSPHNHLFTPWRRRAKEAADREWDACSWLHPWGLPAVAVLVSSVFQSSTETMHGYSTKARLWCAEVDVLMHCSATVHCYLKQAWHNWPVHCCTFAQSGMEMEHGCSPYHRELCRPSECSSLGMAV